MKSSVWPKFVAEKPISSSDFKREIYSVRKKWDTGKLYSSSFSEY